VLLESHRLAVVPHGPFLYDQLGHLEQHPQRPWADDRARLLAVGGVHEDLPATRQEVEALQKQAAPRTVLLLDGASAWPGRVRKELSQVQCAHLATHGFFEEAHLAAEQERLRQHQQKLRRGDLTLEQSSQRVGLGLRSPLAYTGLLLASDPADPTAANRLTGEALVDLALEGLHLCVLSACETGLGKLTGGEGVQGLVRAFHLAGCPNVVASLWKVNDEATAALMTLFYDRLWHKGEPPLEALRQAQLTLYYHPERIGTLARERGPKLKEAVDLPQGGKVAEEKNPQRASTKPWAAFVLSGFGH
jgi:CHAT domain-containing protein